MLLAGDSAFQNQVNRQSQQQFRRFQQKNRQRAAEQMKDMQAGYRAAAKAPSPPAPGRSGDVVSRSRRRKWWSLWLVG